MSCPTTCFLTCANYTSGGEVVLLSKAGGELHRGVQLGPPAPSIIYISSLKSPPQNPSASRFTFPHLRRWQQWSRWSEVGKRITRRGSITTVMVGSAGRMPPQWVASWSLVHPPQWPARSSSVHPPPQWVARWSSGHPPPLIAGSLGLPPPSAPSWWR
jgi:hypothetical protein